MPSPRSPLPGLQALLADIVDYAGLFPPASLSLDEAVHNFARYRRSDTAWMLGRFVIPVSRLHELSAWPDLFDCRPPFRFSVLGTGGADAARFIAALDDDLDTVAAFHARYPARVRVDAMEVRFPSGLLEAGTDPLNTFAAEASARFARTPMDVFFEVPIDERVSHIVPAIARVLAPFSFGLKMRTGGVEASAFPANAHIAVAIAACRDAGIRFKATAGLHHPIRHYSEDVGTEMPGFFNMFGAAALAEAFDFDATMILKVLEEQDPKAFVFSEETMAWRGHEVSLEATRRARRGCSISFGSCSFDEPVDDLITLELL